MYPIHSTNHRTNRSVWGIGLSNTMLQGEDIQ
jgi:hypothetical protein